MSHRSPSVVGSKNGISQPQGTSTGGDRSGEATVQGLAVANKIKCFPAEGTTPSKKKKHKEVGPATPAPTTSKALTSEGAEMTPEPQKRKNTAKGKDGTKRSKVSKEQTQPPCPAGAGTSAAVGHPPPPQTSSAPSNASPTQSGPMEVMVLRATEPFVYEFKEEKKMFHATVATESQFFRVKVFNINLKEKFTPKKIITISDYLGRNGFLEVYPFSSVSDVGADRKMEISSRLIKNANATPKINHLCSQTKEKFVNGVFMVHKVKKKTNQRNYDSKTLKLSKEQSEAPKHSEADTTLTQSHPQTPQMPPAAPPSTFLLKQPKPLANSQVTPRKTDLRKGPMVVMVLNAADPFAYESSEKETKAMFHATVATEKKFFHMKVFNINLKKKFTRKRNIIISDYLENDHLLEVNEASSVSEAGPDQKIEVPNNIKRRAKETLPIDIIKKQASGTIVYGLFMLHKKIVNKNNTIYEIQDNTGHMEVVGKRKCHDIPCEEGDKLQLFCFRLRKKKQTSKLISEIHSFIQFSEDRCFLLQKNVRDKCTYYEIQDNTGKMEVVVYGRLTKVNCEEGDKLKLICFELAHTSEDNWQLRSVIHSYIKVIKVRKNNKKTLNPDSDMETSLESSF
ncbi:PREDICTED: gamma-interferon-inducible protein 16-like [Propithecus coquereli]|uniref:gamma-interferon-inducible protein 16-like n=1 Tax=Propithecus coquereli TaxID=379532 RepID=UPI00063F74D0|nr:PREDICTED: gamma-interferon-inducible protein 16-like [Propithecus coquereli]